MSGAGNGVVASGPGLDIRERDLVALAMVAAWPRSVAQVAAASSARGIDLPEATGQSTERSGGAAMALAPGRWLVEPSEGALPDLPADIGTVTDLTHARKSYVVAGPLSTALVSKIAPLDFDLPRHGAGCVVQTGSAHSTPFTLWRRAADSFVLYVESSYARDFAHSLAAEAEEFLGR